MGALRVERSRIYKDVLYQGQLYKPIFKMSGKVVFKSIDDVEYVDDFEKITDLPTAISQMKYWGIPTNGIRDKEEVIEKLIQHWVDKKKQAKNPPSPEPTPSNMAVRP